MTRLSANIGYAMIFMVIGSVVGFILFWIGFIAYAVTYQLAMGQVLNIGDGSVFERIKVLITLGFGVMTASWVLHRKRRSEKRLHSEHYLKCLKCEYDLRGNTNDHCPECGNQLTEPQVHALRINHA